MRLTQTECPVAFRFPSIHRIRWDKSAEDADIAATAAHPSDAKPATLLTHS